MSSTALCEWCARIPFHDLPTDFAEKEWYDLGTGSRVKDSSCPLCQLVAQAHYQKHAPVLHEEVVELIWVGVIEAGFAFNVMWSNVWISFGLLESTHDAIREMEAAHPGRCLLQPTGSLIDASRILGWIHSCEQEHGNRCQLPIQVPFAEAFRGLPFIRLIDIQASCLVEIQHLVRYSALSYIWGAVANFRLTKTNRPVLLRPGSLNKLSHRLPRTIGDAITVVQRLGCRYLWVDALCLVQNDADDLDQGVNAMDLIYERAWLTIVAACGHDANAGLPGAQDNPREPSTNTRYVAPGIAMGIFVPLDALLDRSMYDSRGWTFQERLLSRRAIYFVEDKLFYRCRGALRAEHLVDLPQSTQGSKFNLTRPWAMLMENPVSGFAPVLQPYTKRALTNQSDAPRAMAGIIQRFSDAMGCQFLEGLPTATFDCFVVFKSWNGSSRRRPAFPSYSWTGWSGELFLYLRENTDPSSWNEMLRDQTWIVWYKRSPSGVLSLGWDPSSEPHFPSHDMAYVGYRERRLFSYGRETLSQLDTSRTTPTETLSFSKNHPPYHILQFWTMSVFYTLSDIDVFDAWGNLVDSNSDNCGLVWFDGFEETTHFGSQTCFEFMLLSKSTFFWTCLSDRFSIAYPQVDGYRKSFNVLLLEWQDGLAERRGYGRIAQDAIVNSLAPGPVWKEILLA